MDFHKLTQFIEIVEEGSISKAALSLNMTQPPLSMSLKKFEQELGFDLFIRRNNKLELSSPGRIVYERGKEFIVSSNAIIKEAKEYSEGKKGLVTIGCSTIANLTLIPQVVKIMKERNINITVTVLEGNTSFIFEQLRSFKMDIGLVRNVFDKENYQTTPLLYESLYVALPSNHKLSNKKSVSMDDLRDENFLMPYTSLGHGISEFIMDACQSYNFNPNVIYWGTETLPMLDMVNEGLGIAFVPALFKNIRNYSLPKLVKLSDSNIKASLNLATVKNSIDKSSTRQFLSILREVIEMYHKTNSLS